VIGQERKQHLHVREILADENSPQAEGFPVAKGEFTKSRRSQDDAVSKKI